MCDSKQQEETMQDEWTDEDVKRAARDGWILALHSDGSEIQRLDDPDSMEIYGAYKPLLDSDGEAAGHVLQVARSGEGEAKQHAQKAVRILRGRQKDTRESPLIHPPEANTKVLETHQLRINIRENFVSLMQTPEGWYSVQTRLPDLDGIGMRDRDYPNHAYKAAREEFKARVHVLGQLTVLE